MVDFGNHAYIKLLRDMTWYRWHKTYFACLVGPNLNSNLMVADGNFFDFVRRVWCSLLLPQTKHTGLKLHIFMVFRQPNAGSHASPAIRSDGDWQAMTTVA